MKSRSLRLGEWLLIRRWWWVALASLGIFFFELLEYMPVTRGLSAPFLFEVLLYGVFLPAATGLALTALASSRSELAWSAYYQSLKHNLELQLYNAHSYTELAEVFLQFARVVVPLEGITLYKSDSRTRGFRTILSWSISKDLSLSNSPLECAAVEGCRLWGAEAGDDQLALLPCSDPDVIAISESSRCFCMPFWFSGSLVAAARLQCQRDSAVSSEQVRLLREVAPEVASAFHHSELEYLVKKRDESVAVEQQRIARDLHDSLGNSLAYLRLRLDQISMEVNQTATHTLRMEVETLRDLAKDAYDQMRDILIALAPENNSNLNSVLLDYLETINKRSRYKLNLQNHGQPRILPAIVQRHIFFIFREALTNIEKHAHAREVGVELNWQESRLEIKIEDDGTGFDAALATQKGHFGLKNMRERAMESNATLTVSSEPGCGTRLLLSVPYLDDS